MYLCIRRIVYLSPAVVEEIKRIIVDSEIVAEDDAKWSDFIPYLNHLFAYLIYT